LSGYAEPLLEIEIEKTWINIRSFMRTSAKNGEGLEAVIVEAIKSAMDSKNLFQPKYCCSPF